jgi:hypothetical protein
MNKMPKKKAKNQNALKHGVYSLAVMLPGEKIGDYEALLAAHYAEWVWISAISWSRNAAEGSAARTGLSRPAGRAIE